MYDGFSKVVVEALDLDELNRLIDYQKDKEHPELGLRFYYRRIELPERELDLRLKKLNKKSTAKPLFFLVKMSCKNSEPSP